MKCEKCGAPLRYKDKYCNVCGEKASNEKYDEFYEKTLWGVLDKINDDWETLSFKKLVDNWVVKLLVLAAVLIWGFFDSYTGLTNIRFLSSETYQVEYNKLDDEYYIRTDRKEVNLNLYIPRYTEKISIKEYTDESVGKEREMLSKEYENTPIRVKKGKFDYLTISSVRGEKTTDCVKVYIID